MADDKQTVDKPEKSGRGIKKLVEVLSIPAGLVAGLIATKPLVERDAEKNLSSQGWFESIRKIRDGSVKTLIDKKLPPAEASRELSTIRQTYRTGKDDVLKSIDAETITKKWGHLKSSQRWNALITGATVTGIFVGAVYAITQSSRIGEMLSDKKDRDIGS